MYVYSKQIIPQMKGFNIMDFSTIIEAIGNDLKISIDDLIHQIKVLREDVEKLTQQKGISND